MSSAFKWIVLKAASVAARNTSTLFFQLYYREMFRELNEITEDPAQTVKIAYNLGYFSAQESAERQAAVLRLFPSNANKIIEYIPLLWEIYFGMPIGKYSTEWDRSDPLRPICNYIVEEDPLIIGLGSDPQRDNLPWAQFWDNRNGYLALMTGLMTQAVSFILALKDQKEAIIVTNSQNQLRNDAKLCLSCQIIPKEELPKMDLVQNTGETGTQTDTPNQNDVWAKLSSAISIDKIEELFATPTGGLQYIMRTLIEKGFHMASEEFLDHFTNYEEEFIKILGFVAIHGMNEAGRLIEKLFENEQIKRIYGHIFLFMKENATTVIPLSVIQNYHTFMIDVYKEIAPESFVQNFERITPNQILTLLFEGAQKALQDLGIDFTSLKPTIVEEIEYLQKAQKKEDSPTVDVEMGSEKEPSSMDEKMKTEKLIKQILLISTTLLSIPVQLSLILVYNAAFGVNEVFSKAFMVLKETNDEILKTLKSSKQ